MLRIIFAGLSVLALAGCGAALDRRTADYEKRWPPVGQFLQVNGQRVHALVQGSGPDVVLLHGASGNLRDFTFDLMGRLATRYRVIALDRPGLGYTDRAAPEFNRAWTARAESPADQAAMLSAAAAQLGADRPIVVGHSFGGAVAMAWALNHPSAGVVSLAGAVMPWPGRLGLQYPVIGSRLGGAVVPPLAALALTPERVSGLTGAIFAPQDAPEGYLDHVGPGLALRPATIRANAKQIDGLRPHLVEMSEAYPDLTLPVEFIHGTADTIVPIAVHSRPAAGILPNARLTELLDVGHMPHHTHPQAVLDAVDRIATSAGLR